MTLVFPNQILTLKSKFDNASQLQFIDQVAQEYTVFDEVKKSIKTT